MTKVPEFQNLCLVLEPGLQAVFFTLFGGALMSHCMLVQFFFL